MKFLGITNRTQGLVFAILIAVALFFAFDPFHWNSSQPTVQAKVEPKRLENARLALKQDARPAAAQVLGLFEKHAVVVVGGHELIKNELDFVKGLIGDLLKAKVVNIGVEFLLSADQADIDRLIAAKTFDSELAQKLLFQRMPMRGYKEYIELLREVWVANNGRAQGVSPLRVVGLGIAQDYSMVKQFEDLRKPEIMRQVLATGILEDAMAATTFRTLGIDPEGKGLVGAGTAIAKTLLLVPQNSAYVRWEDGSYQDEMVGFGFSGKRRLAPVLRDRLGDALATVIFYNPVPFLRQKVGENYPDEGLIDSIIAKAGKDSLPTLPFAINLGESSFGKIALDQTEMGFWASSHKQAVPLWADLADVLVVFGRIKDLQLVEPIDNFVTDQNIAEALKLMPQTMDRQKTKASNINDSIRNFPLNYRKVLDSFK